METLETQLLQAQSYIDRFKPSSLEVLDKNLAKAQKEIIELVSTTQNKAKIRAEINQIMEKAFYGMPDEVHKDIVEISEVAFNSTTAIMSAFVTADLASGAKTFKNIDKSIKKKLLNDKRLIQGFTLEEHLSHLKKSNARKMRGIIFKGQDDGVGIETIAREVRNTIQGINRNTAKTLIRTSLLEASAEANLESMDYFESEVIGWEYSSVIDSRTSKVCLLQNGKRHRYKKDFKIKPKNHYNCRSMFQPYTDISEEFQEKQRNLVEWNKKKVNHRDGTTSTKFTVDKVKRIDRKSTPKQIFDTFGEDYKKDYMGAGRYKLYKSGKATWQDMIKATQDDFIPLRELKQKLNLN